MNKNAGLDNLAEELAALPAALRAASAPDQTQTVILARVIPGISSKSWPAAAGTTLGHWHAFPVSPVTGGNEDMTACEEMPISPFREVMGALTLGMFASLLKREMLRLARNGGCMSLISASLAEKARLATAIGEGTVNRLEQILGTVLLQRLDACDGLGILRSGEYICSLPGLGQLAARNFAEKAQAAFEEAARPFFPTGGINAGQTAKCALGIVNILQGDNANADDLIKRAKKSLEVALNKIETHIHQETSAMPLENTTLVQSSEKRFLFFGGDPS